MAWHLPRDAEPQKHRGEAWAPHGVGWGPGVRGSVLGSDREGARKSVSCRGSSVCKRNTAWQPVPQETRSAAWAGAETSGQAPAQQRFSVWVQLHRLIRNADSQVVPGLPPQQLRGWGPASPVLTSTPANCGTWGRRTLLSRLCVSWGPRHHQATWGQPRVFGETVTGSECILEKSFQYSTENKEKGGEAAGEMSEEVPAIILVIETWVQKGRGSKMKTEDAGGDSTGHGDRKQGV